MDNFTLIAILIMVLGINTIFAYSIAIGKRDIRYREWRRSSFALFSGFFLLLFQQDLPVLISICLANYLILSGFYLQVAAAQMVEYRENRFHKLLFPVLSVIFWILFPYMVFVHPSASGRISVISTLLAVIYCCGTVKLAGGGRPLKDHFTRELIFIFGFSALFYLFRTLLTLRGTGSVQSIFDQNFVVSISLIFPLLFNVSYIIAVFLANLRRQRSRVLQEQEKQGALFSFLNDTARHLERTELFASIERILKKGLGVDTAAIFLKDEGRETYTIVHSFNELNLPLEEVWTIRKGEGAAGKAIAEDRVVSIDMKDYPKKTVSQAYLSRGCNELISAPLKCSGGVIGAMTIANSHNIKKELLDNDFFYYLGEQIGLVLHNAELYEQVSRMAGTDSLTGLYNRRKILELLEKEIERSQRYNLDLSIAMLDIDLFKGINDRNGHECGDEVLKQVTGLIIKGCRHTDMISRWGGEEFLLVCIESDKDNALALCERIRTFVESAEFSCLKDRNVTISAGVASFNLSETVEENIARADKALYSAKEGGRNRVVSAARNPGE